MKILNRLSLILVLALLPSAGLGQAVASSNIAAVEQDRLNQPWWAQRHAEVLQQGKDHPDTRLLMIGDSITHNYDKSAPPDENFQPTWKEFYSARKALNLGFSGDTTANVLWRLRHGEVEGLHPRAAVLLIGTNNTASAHQSALETEVGIDAVIAELERRLPGTRILLLPILPSGISPAKSATDAEVNRYLAQVYGEHPLVTFLDVSSVFLRAGTLDASLFYDPRLPGHPGPLHPDTIGQRKMAEAIEPTLAKLMQEQPAVPLSAMTDVNTALIPVPKLEEDSYDWYARHHAALASRAVMQPQVVLLGDSITHFWAGPPYASQQRGPIAWARAFQGRPALNLGFGWDRIQNVLWRIQQGELAGLHPAFFVLNIGTNNLTGTSNARASTPEEVAAGIETVISKLHALSPESRVILMGIFPRGRNATDPLRAPIRAVNASLARTCAGNPDVTYLDLESRFLTPAGELPATLMPDGTHPGEAGYDLWAESLQHIFANARTRPSAGSSR